MRGSVGFKEFVALMALCMSLVALAIDAMLPALSVIAVDLAVAEGNDRQLVLSLLFFGLAIGQLFYGALSDSLGRRGPIFFGCSIFVIGSVLAAIADSYLLLLIGRFLQGLGAAAPRILTIAIIRDHCAGREMARVMSLVLTVFILVPIIAPGIGQIILILSGWREIFVALVMLCVAVMIWFYYRQPETLAIAARREFRLSLIWQATLEICGNRAALLYTIVGGMVFGAFIGFLNSCQQILQELYALDAKFPLYFAALALTIGIASLVNAKLVVKLGMRYLCKQALISIVIVSAAFLLVCFSLTPSLWMVMTYLIVVFFATGILFGNLNSLAMQPLGHIAGMASSFIGSVTTFISLLLGYVIGVLYNATVIPMVSGFAILSLLSLLLMRQVNAIEK